MLKKRAEMSQPQEGDTSSVQDWHDADAFSMCFPQTPQLGHATYLFSKPVGMTEFLAIYGSVTKDDIRHNRGNVAERLGFLGRLIHGHNPRAWLKDLKVRLGEVVDYAEASVG
jgi:hypothetical protein